MQVLPIFIGRFLESLEDDLSKNYSCKLLKDQTAFIGNISILGNSPQMEFLFFFFEIFKQYVPEE